MRALSHWSEIVAIDRRALAVFRIAMGLVLLFDIAHRLFDLEAHYLDLGAVPRALALADAPAPLPFRLFFLSGGPAGTLALLCLFAAAAVMLVVGRFSRVATALCWLFWCALMARDPFVINFGDRILRLMLFWSIFLPLGSTLSWDARRRPAAPDTAMRVVSVASAAYLVQIVLVYFIGALLKNDPVWTTGQAVQYTLHFDQLTLPLGEALSAYPRLMMLLTFATLALEGVAVLFVFSPLWNGACRLLVVASIVAFHLGLAFTLRLGHFPFVCMVAWIPFLPSGFWDRVLARRPGQKLVPDPPRRLSVAGAVAGTALLLVVAINLDSLRAGSERGLPAPLQTLARYAGLDQRWSMFAPKPLRIDGWFVISGQQRDGRLVDLWSGEAPARWTKPDDPGARYPNHRWMSYMVKLHIDRDRSQQKRHLADYLCRRWNRAHDAAHQVDFVAIDFVQELTLAGGREDQPIPIKLLRQPCPGAPGAPATAPGAPGAALRGAGELREAVSDAAWRRMVASEDWIREQAPRLRALARGVSNLRLPDASTLELFTERVVVRDLAGDPFDGPWERLANGAVERRLAPLAGDHATQRREQLSLWEPVLDRIDYFLHARVDVLDAHFDPPGDPRARHINATLAYHGSARTRAGARLAIEAEISARFERAEASDPGEATSWRISEWESESVELQRSPHPLFVEALDEALDDRDALRAARRSRHTELVLDALLDPDDFERPHPWFSGPSQDRHPALSVADVDGNGWDDIYVMPRLGRNQLYLNLGDGRFVERAAELGLDLEDHSAAAIFADFDNDGDRDAFVGRTLAPSVYFENVGGEYVGSENVGGEDIGARFEDRSAQLLEGGGPLPSLVTSAASADIDGDGLLDLYLSTYAFHMLGQEKRIRGSAAATSAPLAGLVSPEVSLRMAALQRSADAHPVLSVVGPPNVLLQNAGGGRFHRASLDHSLASFRNTYQATFSDFDQDGDPDLYLANDYAPNQLLRNEGGGRFIDVTEETGTADMGFGMGASFGDYDGDGRQDLYVSNMYSKAGKRITAFFDALDPRFEKAARGNTLFRNTGDSFEHVSGLAPPAVEVEAAGWSWGGQFGDFDNDGHLDLYVLSGYYSAPREIASDVDI